MSTKAKANLLATPVLEIIQSAVKTATRYNNNPKRSKNLYEILNALPRSGVTYMLRKKQWKAPDSYIEVTHVDLALVRILILCLHV